MRGYPKHINSKQDVINALEINAEKTKSLIRRAIENREGWVLAGKLESEADGINDATHRVVDKGSAEEGSEYYQEVWGIMPGNLLDRIGMTVAEEEELIQ
ncbi:MAG: hypothetical protein K9L66_00360 [Spirochaetaceae bacterium]|nr:hypothetical protein [Spirochaetaceae bacterium]MCF7947199.1 hypothetical protein [Spirochaetia bacterium]MCF7950064.1 hypothetical protein [Spirochaetaceae bacterium]